MTKKKIWQIAGISFLCVCVLAVGVLGVVFGMNHTSEPVNLATADTQDEIIEYEMTYANGIELFMSSASQSGYYALEQTINAIVLPHYAVNKEVDWELAWANPTGDFEVQNDVGEFMIIIPESDGSTTATLVVFDSFEGHDIAVTCTTRVSSKCATVLAHYVGIPTEITQDSSVYSMLPNSTISPDFYLYNIVSYSTQEYLTNYADFEVSVTPYGTLLLQEVWVSMTEEGIYRNPYEVELSDIVNQCNVTACVVDGKLQISSTNAIESYWKRAILPPNPRPMEYCSAYIYCSGVENCYWLVELTDKTSGLSCSFIIKMYSEPESVGFVDNGILF